MSLMVVLLGLADIRSECATVLPSYPILPATSHDRGRIGGIHFICLLGLSLSLVLSSAALSLSLVLSSAAI